MYERATQNECNEFNGIVGVYVHMHECIQYKLEYVC